MRLTCKALSLRHAGLTVSLGKLWRQMATSRHPCRQSSVAGAPSNLLWPSAAQTQGSSVLHGYHGLIRTGAGRQGL